MRELSIWIILLWSFSIAVTFAIGGTVTYLPYGIVAGLKALGMQ